MVELDNVAADEAKELREVGVVTEARVGKVEYEIEGRDLAPNIGPRVCAL